MPLPLSLLSSLSGGTTSIDSLSELVLGTEAIGLLELSKSGQIVYKGSR